MQLKSLLVVLTLFEDFQAVISDLPEVQALQLRHRDQRRYV